MNIPAENPQPIKEKKDSSKIVYIVIILFLLGTNGYLLHLYRDTDETLQNKEDKLESTENLRAELDSILRVTQLQLEEYKGKNDSLDILISSKNNELRQRASEIENLLRNKKITKKELEKALNELDVFKYYAKKYQKQVDSLSVVVTELKTENEKVKKDLKSEQKRSEDFEMKSINYSNKLVMAQKLAAVNIAISGVRIRSNGKESETQKASRTDQLKIAFNFADNSVAEKGKKDIYIKIIGPDGTTIAIEEAGGGKFKYEGQETLYSIKKVIEFDNSGEPVIIYWKKGSDFKKGRYKVEFYCDNFMIGTASHELK